MKKFIAKVATGISVAGLVGILVSPAAFANEISGNGTNSNNSITTTNVKNCDVTQISKTWADIDLKVKSNSGGNTADNNTNGDVSINTGAATSTADVTVVGGSNTANNPCCCQCLGEGCDGCQGGGWNLVSGNGNGSKNDIVTTDVSNSTLYQKAKTKLKLKAKVKSKTGFNSASGNTGPGTVGVTTDPATSTAGVAVVGGTNTLSNP